LSSEYLQGHDHPASRCSLFPEQTGGAEHHQASLLCHHWSLRRARVRTAHPQRDRHVDAAAPLAVGVLREKMPADDTCKQQSSTPENRRAAVLGSACSRSDRRLAMTEEGGDDGLVCAYLRGPDGRWREVGWVEVRDWKPEQGLLWVHLERESTSSREYLQRNSGLDSIVQEALLAQETRPRALSIGQGLLLILRGVNLNPGADPEDMVSLRLWADPERLITTRHRRVMAIDDLRERLSGGRPPEAVGDLVVQLAARLVERMSGVIETLDEEEDNLEALVVDETRTETRSVLARIRRQAIMLRRYLAPQRDALSRLQSEELGWLDGRRKARLREVTDRVIRYVEDLDAIRERASVIQDELMNRQSDQMNRNMYLLTIVATVMLPLGFITGLLGINVDGIPGSEQAPWAFASVCAGLLVIVAAEIWILRRRRWF
jgi:zinc transporter